MKRVCTVADAANGQRTEPDIPWDTRDAAAYLGLGKFTLEAWRVRGKGPMFHKYGRAVRYYKSDLDAFRAQSARRSTSDTGMEYGGNGRNIYCENFQQGDADRRRCDG